MQNPGVHCVAVVEQPRIVPGFCLPGGLYGYSSIEAGGCPRAVINRIEAHAAPLFVKDEVGRGYSFMCSRRYTKLPRSRFRICESCETVFCAVAASVTVPLASNPV